MENKILGTKGTWREVANSCNTTIGFESKGVEPSSLWKRRILLAEHSPIRQIWVKAKWTNLKYWVSVHFTRHWLGITHWVRSQRPDRIYKTSTNRDDEPQSALIEHEFDVNAQAMINISRKRLCSNAMSETRQAWISFLENLEKIEPELVSVCVPDCVYRGYCYEFYSCGFYLTNNYKNDLERYRKNIR